MITAWQRSGATVIAVTVLTVTTAGCPHGHGPEMRPGEDCLGCHSAGSGEDAEGHPFTAAGTVYADQAGGAAAEGAVVTLIDANAQEIQLTANAVGNFFTSTSITWPATAVVSVGTATATMPSPVTGGHCNDCHDGSTAGRIHAQ